MNEILPIAVIALCVSFGIGFVYGYEKGFQRRKHLTPKPKMSVSIEGKKLEIHEN